MVPMSSWLACVLVNVLVCATTQDPQTRATRPATSLPAQSGPATRPAAARAIEDRLGLRFAVAESRLRRKLIRTSTPYGFKIDRVAADSLAARAGLAAGQVLLTCDGKPLRELTDLADVLQALKPGDSVTLTGSRLRSNRTLLSRRPWEDFEVKVTLPAR